MCKIKHISLKYTDSKRSTSTYIKFLHSIINCKTRSFWRVCSEYTTDVSEALDAGFHMELLCPREPRTVGDPESSL